MGGLIKVCYATDKDTGFILRWMTKENIDNTWNEVDKMEKGKACFYENGFDYPPTKTYGNVLHNISILKKQNLTPH